MTPTRAVLCCLALAAILTTPVAAQEAGAVAVLHLADGSELPLTSWSLSYEYQAWKEGGAQAFSQPVRRESRELWSGKKVFGLTGVVLDIQYRIYEKQVEVDGQPTRGQGAAVIGLVLTAAGKKTEVKPEAPHKDFLVPAGSSKGMVIQARALDLRGETLTGTRRDYCLLSYTPQVECSAAAGERVVRIEFPR
jgi:hypothetical protein